MCSNYQMCKAENLWYPADLEWILENGKTTRFWYTNGTSFELGTSL